MPLSDGIVTCSNSSSLPTINNGTYQWYCSDRTNIHVHEDNPYWRARPLHPLSNTSLSNSLRGERQCDENILAKTESSIKSDQILWNVIPLPNEENYELC
jgi:hypothetical protein